MSHYDAIAGHDSSYDALTMRLAWSEWSRFTHACVRERNTELCQQLAHVWSQVGQPNTPAPTRMPPPPKPPPPLPQTPLAAAGDWGQFGRWSAASVETAFARRRGQAILRETAIHCHRGLLLYSGTAVGVSARNGRGCQPVESTGNG